LQAASDQHSAVSLKLVCRGRASPGVATRHAWERAPHHRGTPQV